MTKQQQQRTSNKVWASQVAQVVKILPASAGDARDTGSIPGLGRSPGVGNGNPLQYSRMKDSVDRGALAGYSPWDHKESDMTKGLSSSSK